MAALSELEVYRIFTDYDGLEDALLEWIEEEMKVTFETIDDLGGFSRGNVQKLLSKSRERWARTLGVESLGKMLKGTGTALVLVRHDARFDAIKNGLAPRKRPLKLPNGSSTRPTWLFTRKMSRKMQDLRLSKLSPAQRKKIARKAGKASGKSRRLRSRLKQMQAISLNHRQSASLAATGALELGCAGVVRNASPAAVTAVQAADCAK